MEVDGPEAPNTGVSDSRMAGVGSMIIGGPPNVSVGLANGFGMTPRPMVMGPGGMIGPNGVGGSGGSGPQEWEWLTMSL
jgi:hypothetical protein